MFRPDIRAHRQLKVRGLGVGRGGVRGRVSFRGTSRGTSRGRGRVRDQRTYHELQVRG